jgi:methionyl-tRNA synthetase
LESDQRQSERVQTQMYGIANCGCVEFTCEPFLPFTAKKYQLLKIESPLNWNTIAQNLI